MSAAENTHFITIDLDLESQDDPAVLIEALRNQVCVLRKDVEGAIHRTSFELTVSGSADALLQDFIALIRALPPPARTLWDGCTARVFDLGFQAGSEPYSITETISAEVVAALAELGASLAVTIYALRPETVSE